MSTTKQRPRPGGPGATRRSYTPFIVLGVILVVAVGIALLASSGGDDSADGGVDGGQLLSTAGVTAAGAQLPPLPEGGDDPAVGTAAPTLEGVSPAGQGTAVGFDQPTLIAFMAHWCPHCQAELPELVELAESGDLDELDAVVVLTGTDESAPNYPPGPWVDREGWTGRVLLDDENGTAASAFGLTSYPYLVLVDAEGNIVDRNAGGLGLDGLRDFVAQVG